MDELKRMHRYAVGSSLHVDVTLNPNGDVILRSKGVSPPISVNLTMALREMVDERVAQLDLARKAREAEEAARGGHE